MPPSPPTSPQIMPRPSRATVESILHGNLISNQSIYANTVTLPKINERSNTQHSRQGASPVRHGSNASNGSNKSNGHNTSKLSSSNSPATTNQACQNEFK